MPAANRWELQRQPRAQRQLPRLWRARRELCRRLAHGEHALTIPVGRNPCRWNWVRIPTLRQGPLMTQIRSSLMALRGHRPLAPHDRRAT